ncbi:hypothetical protein B0H11DRAFT_2223279 [Mycena galericulata]|nr:hypothetical protein B0H11DRAFT_2223279 [Mycena galericulata]
MVKTGGYGPQLYEATTVASSVIYWPDEIGGESEHGFSAEPTPSAGLGELPTHLPNGGTILSVHQPTTTLAWLEENYDHPMLKSIRKSRTFSGPLAMMLFTDKPALALFGPSTPSRARLAQKLANKCKAPVIARPSEDDPIIRMKSFSPTFEFNGAGKIQPTDKMLSAIPVPEPVVVMRAATGNTTCGDGGSTSGATSSTNDSGDRAGVRMRDQPTTNESPTPGSSGGNVGAVQREIDANDDDPERSENDSSNASRDDSEQITVVFEGVASSDGKKTKGHDNDPDDPDGEGPTLEADKWEDWLSPHHTTTMQIYLQRNGERPPIKVDIACQTQFRTYADERMPLDPSRDWTRQAITRPQAQVHQKFSLLFNPEQILLDRSYAVLGLQGDRPNSIIRQQNLDCGFEEPTQTLKTIFSNNVQNSLGVTAGFTGVHPAPTVKATYSRNKSSTHGLEATDSEVFPSLHLINTD